MARGRRICRALASLRGRPHADSAPRAASCDSNRPEAGKRPASIHPQTLDRPERNVKNAKKAVWPYAVQYGGDAIGGHPARRSRGVFAAGTRCADPFDYLGDVGSGQRPKMCVPWVCCHSPQRSPPTVRSHSLRYRTHVRLRQGLPWFHSRSVPLGGRGGGQSSEAACYTIPRDPAEPARPLPLLRV